MTQGRSTLRPGSSRGGIPTPRLFDIGLVVTVALIYALVLLTSPLVGDNRWVMVGCSVATLVPLLWRTQAPVTAWLLVLTIQLAVFLLLPRFDFALAGIAYLSPLIALGAVAARRRVWVSSTALAITYLYLAITASITSNSAYPDSTAWAFLVSGVACGVAWGLGLVAHRYHQRLRTLEVDRADVARALVEERMRIVTDLNGIIRAAVESIVRDAATARYSLEKDPGRAGEAFAAIEATGIEAMHELRRLLHLLKDGPSFTAVADSGPSESPQHEQRTGASAWLSRRLSLVNGADVLVTIATIAATIAFAVISLFPLQRLPASLYFAVVLWVLLWRRAFPLLVFVLVIAADALAVVLFRYGVFVWDSYTAAVPVLVALAAVAAASPLWISVSATLIAFGYLSLPHSVYPEVLAANLSALGVLVVAVGLGGTLAGRRRRLIDRLEREREEATRAAEQQRSQLAYDLHDLVGHAITVAVLQAAGARRINASDLNRAMGTLTPIEEAAADALNELDKLVDVLDDPSTDYPSHRSTAMVHRLDDLEDLAQHARKTVPNVRVSVSGTPHRLEPSVDLAAHHVIREALSNAAKHAGRDAPTDIHLSWFDDVVQVEVRTTSRAEHSRTPDDLSGGFGLLSLRERVVIAGGNLAWAQDGDAFVVTADLPVSSST